MAELYKAQNQKNPGFHKFWYGLSYKYGKSQMSKYIHQRWEENICWRECPLLPSASVQVSALMQMVICVEVHLMDHSLAEKIKKKQTCIENFFIMNS